MFDNTNKDTLAPTKPTTKDPTLFTNSLASARPGCLHAAAQPLSLQPPARPGADRHLIASFRPSRCHDQVPSLGRCRSEASWTAETVLTTTSRPTRHP